MLLSSRRGIAQSL